jgi:AraC family transcriptional activator of tynA and feaB
MEEASFGHNLILFFAATPIMLTPVRAELIDKLENSGARDGGGVEMHVETFSTDHLPNQGRLRIWQQAMDRLAAVRFGTEPTGANPFTASVTAYTGSRLRFSELRFSPHVTTYRGHVGATSARRHFILAYMKAGDALVAQDGRQTVVAEGDIVLVDPLRPLRIETNTAMGVNQVDVCAERLMAVLPQVEGLTSIAFKSNNGAGSILRATLDELFQVAATLSDTMGNQIADAVPHLIAAAMAALPAANQAVPSRLEAYHQQRIREVIRTNLQDPDLDPQFIARAVGLSPRYVHQLFSHEPATLMNRIQIQRLERCREEFEMPSLQHRSISEIAYKWGFTSQAHFSRAFRAHFGLSPRAFRNKLR